MYKIVGMVRSRLTRVTWMLEELGQPYKIVNVAPHSDVMKRYNPTGKVPALIDSQGKNETVVIDSAAICNYLADNHPEMHMSALAGTPDRAAIDSWLHFSQSDLEAPVWMKAKHKFVLPNELRLEVSAVTAYEFNLAIAGMEERLGDKKFAIGDRMTVADILLGHTGAWARLARFRINSDRVNAYFNRMTERPAFKRAREVERRYTDGLKLRV